ncbi:MAG: sulfotransferase family 2 domain-containing protein [Synechococcus sp.]
MAARQEKIFFLHIEKCGGTSVTKALIEAISSNATTPTPIFSMDAKAAWDVAKSTEINTWLFRDRLLAYALSSKHSRLVTGHFRYNDRLHHHYLNSWTFAVVLRDPVDRFLSHYYYNRYKQETHGQITLPLEEYLETTRARRFAGSYVWLLTAKDKKFENISESDIENACQNLKNFHLIGLLEDLQDFSRRCQLLLGSSLDIPVLNTSPNRQKRYQDIDDSSLRKIQEICLPSIRVYEAAQAYLKT